jgi:deoxyhypusine synthase
MVDVIVSTGANMVDQDFFEALGFRHYVGTPFVDDHVLRKLHIDRIYDTFIDEDELRICDETTSKIFGSLPAKPYSSRELMIEFGKYLDTHHPQANSIILSHVSFDSGKDFLELTRIKLENPTTGIFMIGGGVPKNFTQDIVVAAEVLGYDIPMHKYAIQLTVADERDGALSGSTLKEACSWGKVDTSFEQMVFGEATVTFPLIASYAYHKRSWASRSGFRFNDVLATTAKPMTKKATALA